MTPTSEEKWRIFNYLFQSREHVVVKQGQIRRIGCMIKTMEAKVGRFLLGCKCLVRQGIFVQEQHTLGDLPAGVFFQNVLQLHQQRWVTLRIDSLALWKIFNDKDASWFQKIEARTFQRIFAIGFCWGGVSRYASTPLIVALSPAHSDINKFRPWSPIATGNHLDRTEKIPNLLRRLAPLTFLILVQTFRDPLHREHPHVQIFMNDAPNPFTWDSQLLSYWFSRNPAFFQD